PRRAVRRRVAVSCRKCGVGEGRSWSVSENWIASPRKKDCGSRNALSALPCPVSRGMRSHLGALGKLLRLIIGEFDPGSERTLAACLTHASRGRKPARVSKPANGCVTRG